MSTIGPPKKMAKSDFIVNEINKYGKEYYPNGVYTAMSEFPKDFALKRNLLNLKNALKSNKFKGKSVDVDALLTDINRIS